MDNKFDIIYLDEKALPFVIKKLHSLGEVGEELTNLIKTSEFRIWGFFQNSPSKKNLLEFDYGGIFEHRPLEEVIKLIHNRLEKDILNCWILIDNNGNVNYSPNQNAIENITKVFFYKGTVFHLLISSSNECIHRTFKATGAYPFVGFITKLNDSLKQKMLNNNIDEVNIKELIKKTAFLVIGAYDEEGYLIIEKGN